ncbi:unnamed protein product [Somion occarium]|uniref:non-specific serine/threonine protein kinase n=1 Tax=Somion occarium TaxID=3059160 RepID=A0ABP1CI81_9APHY
MLTYGGLDYLAMRALSKRDSMYSVGNQIGVGKESDIYIVADAEGNEMVLKLHRLGRVSFRAIKEKRDYMGKRKSASWMYMSRLSAQKEWAFMKVLHEHGFPIPKPIDQARHCILMEFIDAYPLYVILVHPQSTTYPLNTCSRQVSSLPSPGVLYSNLMDVIVRFARAGLIHGDFNEFNILIRRDTGEAIVIDFPQMVSTSHVNAEWYFNRDVECIRTFFRRRFQYESNLYPRFRSTMKEESEDGEGFRLDVVVAASGFKKSDQQVLEEYMNAVREQNEERAGSENDESEEEESEEEEEAGDQSEEEPAAINERETKDIANSVAGPSSSTSRPEASGSKQVSDEGPQLSPTSRSRPLSRSPPASRHTSRSPSSLAERTAALSISHKHDLKERVASEVTKDRARQQRKYHSKRGAQRVGGRQKGSKAKMDTRVKVDQSGVWE